MSLTNRGSLYRDDIVMIILTMCFRVVSIFPRHRRAMSDRYRRDAIEDIDTA